MPKEIEDKRHFKKVESRILTTLEKVNIFKAG